MILAELIRKFLRGLRNTPSDGDRKVIHLYPDKSTNQKILISYLTKPFLERNPTNFPTKHSNYWECYHIAQTYLSFGFEVDIIEHNDHQFIPSKEYDIILDIHSNLERLAEYVKRDCRKILHITGAHWLFQNQAEYSRLLDLQERRGVTLQPRRLAAPSLGIEHADCATILGNQFTIDTFAYAEKPVYRLPITTTTTFPWSISKDYSKCRRNFLWLGGAGMVHKGLDLVLEAFSMMREVDLTVCGPLEQEKDFKHAFHRELYQAPNIHALGWVDVGSPTFREIAENCVGIVYPTCSEGGGGSVVTCMHAGLIPIVSYEASVDIEDFGVMLKSCTIDEIIKSVTMVADLPEEELRVRSRKAWEFARANHSREKFLEEYKKFCYQVLRLKSASGESEIENPF